MTAVPTRRWFRFSTRTLLLAVLACSVLLGFWTACIAPYRGQHEAVEQLDGKYRLLGSEPAGPEWLRWLAGERYFRNVSELELVALTESYSQTATPQTTELWTSTVGDADLVHLRQLPRLKKLKLFGPQVTDAGLSHLHGLQELKELRLIETKVTDRGLEVLRQLPHLTLLELSGSEVTERGIEKLRRSLPNCTIIR